MTRILHLSDVHLAPVGVDPDAGDYKEHAVPAAERQTRRGLLSDALASLTRHLTAPLDAVIVSGDVTLYGREDGFPMLPELLDELGGLLPADPARIVVVPGNHDIVRDTAPSSRERYERFLALEAHGYTLPLLDGIDVGPGGARLTAREPTVMVGDDVLIVAMNSANYSGMLEPLPAATQKAVDDAVASGHLDPGVAEDLADSRRRDAARISPGQLRALAAALKGRSAGTVLPPLRIAVLHHQLLPVSATEEYKPFESLSNLGEVRQFLLSAGFDVALHGHKHMDNVFVDEIADALGDVGTRRTRRLLVCSCGTVGGGRGHGSEVAKLLEVATTGRARSLSVLSVPGLSSGSELHWPLHGHSFQVQRHSVDTSRVVQGATTGDVQSLLREMFDDAPDKRVADLVCVVEDTTGAGRLPDAYPTTLGRSADDEQEWFAETVAWWQNSDVVEGKPFTHGQRIRAFGHSRRDQLLGAAELLKNDPGSSRAVIVLVEPEVDLPESDVLFPSFTALQFHSEGSRLHATALFRKQEMRFWWAVNVAEIVELRGELLDMVAARGRTLHPGRITTIASQALGSQSPPSVAVPAVDRLAWTFAGPHRLWLLCTAVFDEGIPSRQDLLGELRALVLDWAPPAVAGPDGVAVPGRGLGLLRQGMESLQAQYAGAARRPEVHLLVEQIRLLDVQAENYRLQARIDAGAAFLAWRNQADQSVAGILSALDTLTGAVPGDGAGA